MTVWLVFEAGGDAELAADDAPAVIRELDALGFRELATAITQRERGLVTEGVPIGPDNARQIARALDHLRNAEPRGEEDPGAHRALHDARDRVLMRFPMAPLTYRLRSWELDGKDGMFWSYTGEYGEGDRIVTADGRAWRVTEVVQEATKVDDGVLVIEGWRDPA